MQPPLISRTVLTGCALAALVAACSGAAVAPPTASPAVAASPSVTATPVPTVFGPTAFAAWTDRQGFGGSSGLHNVAKLGAWLVDHTYDATTYDLDSDRGEISALIAWLDAHPPTACWTAYHTAISSALQSLLAPYADARAARAADTTVPTALATTIRDETQAAYAMPTPANCP